jgi:hypothetical protein
MPPHDIVHAERLRRYSLIVNALERALYSLVSGP